MTDEKPGLINEQLTELARAMTAPISRRLNMSSVGREAFKSEPLRCGTCGLPYADGEAIGCRECVTRSVMES